MFRQDVSEDLKLSLNRRIESALAKQGWEKLASELGRNDHLNVRLLREQLHALVSLLYIDGLLCAYMPTVF